ncbi:CDP-alcohol phosphatidyltransferase family protein [Candidatus Falkowbacteria bacterium]|nr:CDP-alcohol phosphatidyltransferase family protein [Candidatus Falkowbacteria bacterium]
MVPLIFLASHKNYWPFALFFFTIAWLADFFDGWLARKRKLNTQIGAFYDPLADKIFTISFLIWFWDYIEIAFIVPIIAIGTALTILRVYKWYYGTKKRVDYSIMASVSGKAKTNLEKSAFALLLLWKTFSNYGLIPADTIQSTEIGVSCLLSISIFFALFSLHHQIKEI